MKFSIGAILALAAAVLAQPKFTNSDFTVTEGEPFTLTWSNAQGPVTIKLKTGPSTDLKTVSVLTTGETGTEFTWTPAELPSGTYAFEIDDSSATPNYSKRFEYVGTGTVSSSTALSSTASSSSTSASVTSTSTSSSTETESTSSTSSESSTSTTLSTTTTQAATSTRANRPTNTVADLNGSERFASPLGFVLLTVAALIFFN